MTLPRPLVRALVGAVAACVALSGCTPDDPAPAPSTSASTTEEPAPEPTDEPVVAAPEKPTLMDSNDAIGARAAAEYFLSLYGYVFQTGDLTEWDAMCHPESEFCNEVRGAVNEHVADRDVQSGGGVTMSVTQVVAPSGALEEYEVIGLISQETYEIVDETGAPVTSGGGDESVPTSVFLRMTDTGDWVVRAVVMDAS